MANRSIPNHGGLTVGALGEAGWAAIDADTRQLAARRIPLPARNSLPAIYLGDTLVAVPHLPFAKGFPPAWRLHIQLIPQRPLTTAGFGGFPDLAGPEPAIV